MRTAPVRTAGRGLVGSRGLLELHAIATDVGGLVHRTQH
jgi:hypothetical protein